MLLLGWLLKKPAEMQHLHPRHSHSLYHAGHKHQHPQYVSGLLCSARNGCPCPASHTCHVTHCITYMPCHILHRIHATSICHIRCILCPMHSIPYACHIMRHCTSYAIHINPHTCIAHHMLATSPTMSHACHITYMLHHTMLLWTCISNSHVRWRARQYFWSFTLAALCT